MQSINQKFISVMQKIFLTLLMAISLGISAGFMQPGLPFSPDDIPDLTEEERAAFELIGSLDEQELGQLMQEIEREFEKLSDEEKQIMLNEIDREAHRLQGKINTYYSDQGLPPMTPTEPIEAAPVEKKAEPKPAVQPEVSKDKKELLSKRIKTAEALIARVLQVIEKYILTGQTIPDFDDQIEEWGKKEEIKNWKRGLNWVLFKDDIDNLVRKLHKVKDRDPNTKLYKYLENVVQDESLYNGLIYIDRELQKHGPELQGVSLETGLLPSQAETAIQQVTGLLAEAIYQLHIPAGLDKAIELYQTTAVELKAKQEEYEKQALAEEKQSKQSRPVYVVGDEPEQYGGVTIPTMPAVKRPAYRPPSARKQPKPAAKKPEKKPELLSGPVGKGKRQAIKEQKKPSDKKKTEEKKKEKVKEDKTAEGFLKDIATGLAQATSTLNRELKNIKGNVTGSDPVNESLVKSSVPNITKQLEKVANAAEALDVHIKGLSLNKEQKAHYTKQFKNTIKAQTKPLSAASKELKQLRSNISSIPAEKAYAYFGGVIRKNADKEKMKDLPKTNLGDLESALSRVMSITKKK